MAVVRFLKTNENSDDRACVKYICKNEKTENLKYVSTLNCSLPTVIQEYRNTRSFYGKSGVKKYYHWVQSHPRGYKIDPALAHKIAIEFAERAFKDFECVIATHTDREHIHSHIMHNSVNLETGLIFRLKHYNSYYIISNEICRKYGVPCSEFAQNKSRVSGISSGEYYSALKGQSWKIQLILTIDEAMKSVKSKEQFCSFMNLKGYKVKWEEGYNNIKYTTSSGKECRDFRLHDEKYLKENMENEFEIRRNERSFFPQLKECFRHSTDELCSGFELESSDRSAYHFDEITAGDPGTPEQDHDYRSDGTIPEEAAGCYAERDREVHGDSEGDFTMYGKGDSGDGSGNKVPDITGWEAERAILIESERVRREDYIANERNKWANHFFVEQSESGDNITLEKFKRFDNTQDNGNRREAINSSAGNKQSESEENAGFVHPIWSSLISEHSYPDNDSAMASLSSSRNLHSDRDQKRNDYHNIRSEEDMSFIKPYARLR